MEMLTLQQIYDKGYAHIMNQGGPCSDGQSCVYRNKLGEACIAGCFMPDETIDSTFNKISIRSMRNYDGEGVVAEKITAALLAGGVDLRVPRVEQLLIAMQLAHDGMVRSMVMDDVERNFMPGFKSRMKKVAADFNLVYNEGNAS